MCGEQLSSVRVMSYTLGSSPRVRGTVNIRTGKMVALGIIPACAGNSYHNVTIFDTDGDHPRVCGEQWPISTDNERWMGSSPRVRGTVLVTMDLTKQVRIIPACAGNSSCNA